MDETRLDSILAARPLQSVLYILVIYVGQFMEAFEKCRINVEAPWTSIRSQARSCGGNKRIYIIWAEPWEHV